MDQAGGRAIISIAEKIGWAAETLRSRMRQAERDGGRPHGLTTDERGRRGGYGGTRRCSRRLLEPLRYVPPAEFKTAYHDRQAAPVGMAVLT